MVDHITKYKPFDSSDLWHLPDEERTRVEQVRIEARDIQKDLEPSHIHSWHELVERLDHAYRRAMMNAEVLGGFNAKAYLRRKRREERIRRFVRMLQNAFNFKKKQ